MGRKGEKENRKGGRPGDPSYKHAVCVDQINDDAQLKRRLKSGISHQEETWEMTEITRISKTFLLNAKM